jgi:hypothetical protein
VIAISAVAWILQIRGMQEQVWRTLEEQGIGTVLAAAATKLSVASQMQPPGLRANKVASECMKECQNAAQRGGCLQGTSDAADLKVAMSPPCAAASDEQAEPDTAVG